MRTGARSRAVRASTFGVGGLLALALVLVAGCATSHAPMHATSPRGSWHVVEAGETAETLSRRGGVPVEDFLEINGLERPSDVHQGLLVFVLEKGDAIEPTKGGATAGTAGAGAKVAAGTEAAPVSAGGGPLGWPLAHPRLSSPFGARWGRPHEGIDLSTPPGTPVWAAADGVVSYAGNGIRGYGNLLVISHDGGLITVYAHNAVLTVRQGEHVKRGQTIAMSGQSGRATAPHLHFEVRRGESPMDPLALLPPLKLEGTSAP